MKLFIFDVIVGSLATSLAIAAVIWWNAPDYQGCATVRGQTLCYTVMK